MRFSYCKVKFPKTNLTIYCLIKVTRKVCGQGWISRKNLDSKFKPQIQLNTIGYLLNLKSNFKLGFSNLLLMVYFQVINIINVCFNHFHRPSLIPRDTSSWSPRINFFNRFSGFIALSQFISFANGETLAAFLASTTISLPSFPEGPAPSCNPFWRWFFTSNCIFDNLVQCWSQSFNDIYQLS